MNPRGRVVSELLTLILCSSSLVDSWSWQGERETDDLTSCSSVMVEEMGQIIMRNWDLREFRVRVNLPSPIRQVWVPIRRVITTIRGLPNPIRPVVPLISHIRSYPPHRSHLHPPSLSFSSTSQPSSQNTKLSHPSLSLHGMIMSWHRVQHTPSTASTKDWLSSLHCHNYELTPEWRVSFRHGSLHDRPPSASSLWELKIKVTLSHSHGCELTNWWIEPQHQVCRPSTASKYSSNLTRSRPPSLYLNSLDYGLQFRTIMASKCISKLAQSHPPSVSPNSLNYGLQVRTIMASKCISEFTPSWPPSASLSSLDLGLQVQFSTRAITASKCIVNERQWVYGDTGVTEDNHRLLPVQIHRV